MYSAQERATRRNKGGELQRRERHGDTREESDTEERKVNDEQHS